jgi:hypothetical protein
MVVAARTAAQREIRAFSSLTVEISATELTWSFGPGSGRNSIAREEIISAMSGRNKWWWGWAALNRPRWDGFTTCRALGAAEIALHTKDAPS